MHAVRVPDRSRRSWIRYRFTWRRGRQCSCSAPGAIWETVDPQRVRRVRHAGVSTRALDGDGGPGAGPASFLSMEEAGLVSLPSASSVSGPATAFALGCSPPQSIRIHMLSKHAAGCSTLCITITPPSLRVHSFFTLCLLTGDERCADRLYTPGHA
jgi:hypothetical protein